MATRFYLSSTATTPVTPGFAGWSRTTEGDRRKMSPTKDGSARTDKTLWANGTAAANETALCRQFVGDPMEAGIAFATSDTIKCYILCREESANDNINRQPICVKVVSEDGTTLRATLKGLGHIGPNTTEWTASTNYANKTLTDGDTLDANYTTVAGDRLVIEVGGQVSNAGGNTVIGHMNFGADQDSDLGENETDSLLSNHDCWFEISRTITFAQAVLPADQGSYGLSGQAAGLLVGRRLHAETGAFAESGQAVDLEVGYRVAAAMGSFALSGQAAGLLASGLLTVALKQGPTTIASWIEVGPSNTPTTYAHELTSPEIASIALPADGISNDRLSIVVTADHRQMRVTHLEVEVPGAAASIVAGLGTFAVSGQAVALLVGFRIATEHGSYALAGQAAGVLVGRRLVAEHGAFALSGQDTALSRSYQVAADAGSYALAGQTADPRAGRLLGAAPGAYQLAGQDAQFRHGYTIAVEVGTYTLSGQSIDPRATRAVPANHGVYALTGQAVSLLRSFRLSGDVGTFALIGTAADLERGYLVAAAAGSFTWSGQAADLRRTTVLGAGVGLFTLSGPDVQFVRPGILVANPGSFTLSGEAANLLRGYRLALEHGVFGLAGQDAELEYSQTPTSFTLDAAPGGFTLSGMATGLRATRLATAAPGAFASTGFAAGLTVGRGLPAAPGAFDLVGQAAAFAWARRLTAGVGTFALTGQLAVLEWSDGVVAPSIDHVLVRRIQLLAPELATVQLAGSHLAKVAVTAPLLRSVDLHPRATLPED